MPKLNKTIARRAQDAEPQSGAFEPLKPGKYVATLAKVEARTTNAGNPMWVAEFTDLSNLASGERAPGRQWYNLNLPVDGPMPKGYQPKNSKKTPKEAWETSQNLSASRLHAFFDAFGYTTDSDTDEMLGEQCVLQVGIRTIQQGARTGERVNNVNAVLPLPDDYVPVEPADEDAADF